MEDILEEAQACTQCSICLDICPTYTVTGDPLFSPMARLNTAVKLFEDMPLNERLIESLYNCPKCMQCEKVCPEGIAITRVVHKSREELVRRGLGPLQKHNRVIEGILKKGNSVNGDPASRRLFLRVS